MDGRGVTLDALRLDDPAATIDELVEGIRREVLDVRRRGAVVGLSGGVDSSVVAALAVRAFGPDRVVGVLMPEAESDEETLPLAQEVADALGIETVLEDLTSTLRAAGCYARRDAAFRRAIPGYGRGWKAKLALPSVLDGPAYALYSVVALAPDGTVHRARLDRNAYLQVVAATSLKQRTRMMMAYYHADLRNFAVLGTPNRLEYDQGFFVKHGDGAADVKPIAHLFKTQVYQLAGALGIPDEVLSRPPTTDTYALPQTQDEFYFALPYEGLDLCLWALDRGLPANEVAPALGLDERQVQRVFLDVQAKRRVARYLHAPPRVLTPQIATA